MNGEQQLEESWWSMGCLSLYSPKSFNMCHGNFVHVNREFRGKVPRTISCLLQMAFFAFRDLDVMNRPLGKHDNFAIKIVEAALSLANWSNFASLGFRKKRLLSSEVVSKGLSHFKPL